MKGTPAKAFSKKLLPAALALLLALALALPALAAYPERPENQYVLDEAGVPMIAQAPVTMVCSVEDIYKTKGFESFICTIDATYAEETVLDEAGKLDYRALKPVLFEMPTYEYLRTGDVIGRCMSFGKEQQE